MDECLSFNHSSQIIWFWLVQIRHQKFEKIANENLTSNIKALTSNKKHPASKQHLIYSLLQLKLISLLSNVCNLFQKDLFLLELPGSMISNRINMLDPLFSL